MGWRSEVIVIAIARPEKYEVNGVHAPASELYKTLYQIEESDVSKVLVELPPDSGEWAAILDRLRRAAGKES